MKRKLLILPLLLCYFCFAFAATDTLHFAAIGDMGCGCAAQEAIAEEMLEWHAKYPFRFVLTTGDNIYGDGLQRIWNRRKGGSKALFYEHFDRYYNPLRKRGVLFFASLGNHDFETRHGRDLIDDRVRFNILSNTGYYYFSPDPNLVTFVALNTENILVQNANPSQLKWLQKVLSESKSIWKIVYGHHAIYSPPGSHPVDVSFRKALEPILVKNGVQIYISGHNHFYARMKPKHGVIHFTTGGGGRHLKTPRATSETDVVARAHHFMHFELREGKLNFWAIPIQGPFLDRGTVRISSE
ncbi:metallophosphoesterase [bacterium]|nr:metallophosphoesterase [bacterium]